LLTTALLLAVVVPLASAAPEAKPGYGHLANFGAGEIVGPFYGGRNAITRDGHGNIIVADESGEAVHLFEPDSTSGAVPLVTFNPGITPAEVAADTTNDVIYASQNPNFGGGVIKRFVSDGAPVPTYTKDPGFEVPLAAGGMVVDPTSHDLLVNEEGAEVIRRYDTSGTLVDSIATPGLVPQRLALAPDGSIYAAQEGGSSIHHFSTTGTLLGKVQDAGPVKAFAVNPANGILVVETGSNLKRFSPAGTLEYQSPSRDGFGLTFDGTSERIYEFPGGSVDVYVLATFPGVEAPVLSAITATGAHLSAEVDPGVDPGGSPGDPPPAGSVGYFEYSVDGGTNWTPTLGQPLSGPETVQADLTGLVANSDYLVRAVAENSLLSQTSSAVPLHTLLAPPEVETGGANSVTDTSAELTGTIETTFGSQTTYRFEYGLTTSYGSEVPAGTEASAGSERTPRTFSRVISGLQPHTTYHYRMVAKNSAGEAAGTDRTFTTSGAGVIRAYEQVSPRIKKGGSISPVMGFQAAPDGSGVMFQLGQAPTDASSSVLFSRVLSRRTSTGWLDWRTLDPPINTAKIIIESVTHAVSPDFTHSMVVSNRVLTPVGPTGPYEDGGNLYIQDLETGQYTFVGGAPDEASFFRMASPQTENIYLAGAPDFSWVVFVGPRSLLPGAPTQAMYRWSRGEGLTLESSSTASVLPPDALTSRFVSDDGTVMYYDQQDGDGAVYRHDLGGATAPVSVAEAGAEVPQGTVVNARLDGISRDGRYAIIRTQTRLTADNPPSISNVWMYRVDTQSGDIELIGQSPNTSGYSVYAVGDDAKTVYFADEESGAGTKSWRDGVTHTFTASDLGGGVGGASGLQHFASPNGRYLAYVDTNNGTNGTVHLYDAEAQTDVCVSCPPGGLGARDYGLPTGIRTVSNRTPEVVNDHGEMFFDTSYPLVAEDHNATRDVYRYLDGQLTLISPGNGPYVARFGDATPDGSDVFFTTDEALVPGDTDQSLDVYDARVGGGFAEAARLRRTAKAKLAGPRSAGLRISNRPRAARRPVGHRSRSATCAPCPPRIESSWRRAARLACDSRSAAPAPSTWSEERWIVHRSRLRRQAWSACLSPSPRRL